MTILSSLLTQLMKKLVTFLYFLTHFVSCKKAEEKVAEDLVIQAMTNGQWVITKFTQSGTDITTSFSGYKFQYYSNRTVDAIKNSLKEFTGSWNGDANAMTTWADFPGAGNPISLLNGTWQITRNSWTYVEATQTNGTEIKTFRLDKQ
jgi:hypothetical protein